MQYYPIELHSHTHHSDGGFSTRELIEAAIADGYQILTITDHNTLAPFEDYQRDLHDELGQKILVVPGIEWTTFFGHMLVVGADRVIDWRDAAIDTIDASMREVKAASGLIGIAHPFSIGNPICTGCHWDFHIEDYRLVDYIEVWNRSKPDEDFRSTMAYDWWLDLLKQGYHISCTAGRDWHRPDDPEDNTGVTYIGLTDFSIEGVKSAIAAGNFYISLGPSMTLSIEQKGQTKYMGAELEVGTVTVNFELGDINLDRLKHFGFVGKKLEVWHNQKLIKRLDITIGEKVAIDVELETPGYLRFEVIGLAKGKENKQLILSNPFYIQ